MTAKLTAGVLVAAGMVFGQTAGGRLSFEVAAVKLVNLSSMKSGAGAIKMKVGTQVEGNRVDINFLSLNDLIVQAYGLKSYQLTGPDWMSSERFEIHAKMPDSATKDQVPEMLQSLLADRFKLSFHREKKDHQVYALLPGRNGAKLTEVEPDLPAAEGGPNVIKGGGDQVRTFKSDKGTVAAAGGGEARVTTFSTQDGGSGKVMMSGGPNMHIDRKMTMPALCDLLTRFMERPVVDMTEPGATYQITLDLPIDKLMKKAMSSGNVVVVGNPDSAAALRGGDASEPADDSAMVHAIQQLGLRLEQRKAPMDILVVDHAEKTPTEN